MSIKKELDAVMMALERCQVERYGFVVICRVDVGMSIKKRLYLVQLAPSSSIKECIIKISLRSHGRDDP